MAGLSAILLCCVCQLPAQKKPVTVEAIIDYAEQERVPAEIVWAPDGRRFAYQQDETVFLYDAPAKTRRELIALATLRRAAKPVPASPVFEWRNRGVKEQTVQWSPGGDWLLVSAGGDLFQCQAADAKWVQLTETDVAESDPKLSPDGRLVSFRRGNDLYSMEVASRKVRRLTSSGSDTLWNGRLDWVYPEELDLPTAHWWSPDSKSIAYLQFDVSREPLYPHADLLPAQAVYEPQRYPKAGEPNATVRLGVVRAQGGSTKWMDLGDTGDALLARVDWIPGGRGLFVQRLNRIQNRLDLLRVDAATGKARLVLREEDARWVNVGDFLQFLKDGAEFLWGSERDGFRHLYRYSVEGKELARLTSGDWEVTELSGVDESSGNVFFLSTQASPLERQLYRVKLDGLEPRRITQARGTHAVWMGPKCEYFLDAVSSLASPTRRVILRADGGEWAVFAEAEASSLGEYDLRQAEIVQVKASDGTLLYGRLTRPAGFQPERQYPAVVLVYGGPHVQGVMDAWQGLNLEQALAHRGFVVWQLDNRGSGGRGHEWESVLFRNFGQTELADQKLGVEHLVSMGFVDPSRIGIHGWSYGGYLTLYSLLNAPDMFRAGAAGAPVTDWRNYDTIYTERYLGLPSENATAYLRGSLVSQAANLKGDLLILHNLEDDNVLFQNTLQMADALEQAGKRFEMVVYPQKTHGVTDAARRHMLETVVAFFEEHLTR